MSTQFFDLDREKTVLAYALATLETFGDAVQTVSVDLLEDTRHKRIWDGAKFYYQKYAGVLDRSGLETLLKQSEVPQDKQVMYITLLDEIRAKVVTKDQYKVALDTLKDLKFRRGLYDMVNSVAGKLQRGAIDQKEVCNEVVRSVLDLQTGNDNVVSEISFKESLIQRQQEYQDRLKFPEKYRGLPYGIKKLDDLTGGVLKGELSIIFGRPASGKSTVAHNIAYNAARIGKRGALVTIEMPKNQLGRRLDSRHFRISARGLRNSTLNTNESEIYMAAKDISLPGDIVLVDMPQGCSVAQLLPVVRRLKMQGQFDFLVIDYMNLMEPSKWSNSKVERTSDIVRELKMLARLEEIPVITPARATRDVMNAEEDEVGTEHLSWSDAIGYDADQIIYLKPATMINMMEGQLEALSVKFRDGSNEKVMLGVNWDRSFLGDLDTWMSDMQGATTKL